MSDEDKQKHFKKQIEYILGAEKIDFRKMIPALRYMYDYSELSNIYDYEDKFIEILSEHEENEEEIFRLTMVSDDNKSLDNFAQKLEKARAEKKIARCVRYLNSCAEKKEYIRLSVLLTEMPTNSDYLVGEQHKKRYLRPEILDVIKRYNYFFDNLDGTISEAQWDTALYAADIARKNNLSNEALEYLRKLDWHSSCSIEERYKYLEYRLIEGQ